MSTTHVVVTLLAAAMSLMSGIGGWLGAGFIVDNLTRFAVPRSWWRWLHSAKIAGGTGLLVGLWLPPLGVAAGTGLVLFFCGAVITVLRARAYPHLVPPLAFAAPVVAALLTG